MKTIGCRSIRPSITLLIFIVKNLQFVLRKRRYRHTFAYKALSVCFLTLPRYKCFLISAVAHAHSVAINNLTFPLLHLSLFCLCLASPSILFVFCAINVEINHGRAWLNVIIVLSLQSQIFLSITENSKVRFCTWAAPLGNSQSGLFCYEFGLRKFSNPMSRRLLFPVGPSLECLIQI